MKEIIINVVSAARARMNNIDFVLWLLAVLIFVGTGFTFLALGCYSFFEGTSLTHVIGGLYFTAMGVFMLGVFTAILRKLDKEVSHGR